jgi:hypothetical protein
MLYPQTLSRQRVTRPTPKSCNTRTRWSDATSIAYCVRCEAIAGEAQTEVFASCQGSCSPCCWARQVAGWEPAQLRGATKEPDNIHVKPDGTHSCSSRRQCITCVAQACDPLHRHRKIYPRGEIIVVLACHWPQATK